MAGEHVPRRPDPVEPTDHPWRVLVWTTIGTNLLLGAFAFAGWLGRPRSCAGGCSWRPAGGMVWVAFVLIDVGLVLIWTGIGYVHLRAMGERIGRRIADRRDGDGAT